MNDILDGFVISESCCFMKMEGRFSRVDIFNPFQQSIRAKGNTVNAAISSTPTSLKRFIYKFISADYKSY